MLLVADSWISPRIRMADARIASNVLSSKPSVSLSSLSAKRNLMSIGKTGSLRMSTYAMCKKNTFNDMWLLLWMCTQYFYQGIFLSFCFASPQDHLIADGMLRLYVTLHQPPLIINLGFEETMATHNLIKKCSYRQRWLISDWFGFQPFSETTNADNNMVLAIYLREIAKI